MTRQAKENSFLAALILAPLSFGLFLPIALSFAFHLSGLIGCAYLYANRRLLVRPDKTTLTLLACLAVFPFWNVFMAFKPEQSFCRAIKIAGEFFLFIPFLFLIKNLGDDSIKLVKKYFIAPFFIIVFVMLIELSFNFPIMTVFMGKTPENWILNKNLTVFTLLLPFVFFFELEQKRKYPIIILALLYLPVFFMTPSQSAQLAAIVIISIFVAYKIFKSYLLPLCIGGAAFVFATMPFLSPWAYHLAANSTESSALLRNAAAPQRLEIWDFVSKKIMENPLWGYGIDSTRSLYFDGAMVFFKEHTVMHPHNIALQIWIEFGLIGAIFSCGILYGFYRSLKNIGDEKQVFCLSIFAGTLSLLMETWSIWSSWLVGFCLVLMALCQMMNRRRVILA